MDKIEKRDRFINWWGNVPQCQAKMYKDKICRHCNITKDIFSNWLCLRTEIPHTATLVIEQVIKEPIFSSEEPLYSKRTNKKINV